MSDPNEPKKEPFAPPRPDPAPSEDAPNTSDVEDESGIYDNLEDEGEDDDTEE